MSAGVSSPPSSDVKAMRALFVCALLARRCAGRVMIVDGAGLAVLYSRLSAYLILKRHAVFRRDGVGDPREPYAGEGEAWEGEIMGRISAIGHSATAGGRDSGSGKV